MKPETDTQDIALLIEQARSHRDVATGAAIVDRSRRVVAWILAKADAFLHRLLMSPVPNTRILKEN